MTTITLFLNEGYRDFEDEKDRIFDCNVKENYLYISERVRLIPGTEGNFKSPRMIHIFPPGTWKEIEVNYT